MAFSFLKTTPATVAGQPFAIKEWLKAAGWTVPASSDGTTYNAAGDQITHAGSGANGLANNSAWFVLRSPNGAVYFSIQRGTSDTATRVKVARAAFAAGSPDATHTPATATATDQILMHGGGTDAAPTFSNLWGGTPGIYRLWGAVDLDAPYGFWTTRTDAGGSAPGHALVLDPLENTIAGDAFPYVAICASLNVLTAQGLSDDTPAGPVSYLAAVAPTAGVAMPAQASRNASGIVVPGGLPSTREGKVRQFRVAYARRSALASPGYKGVSSLLRWMGTILQSGTVISVSGSRDRLAMAEVSLPWDGTEPVL